MLSIGEHIKDHAILGVDTPSVLKEIINHADLLDMPDIDGSITDHDARYFTETETLTLIAGANFDFFLNDTASGVGAYFTMSTTPTSEAESTFSDTISADATLIDSFITPTGEPTFTTISAGIYSLHFHATATIGAQIQTVRIYYEFWKRTAGGAETLIATSEESDVLTSIKTSYNIHCIHSEVTIDATDLLLIKVYANLENETPPNDPTVTIYAEGTNATRFSATTNIGVFDSRYLMLDCSNDPLTAQLDCGSHGLTTTGDVTVDRLNFVGAGQDYEVSRNALNQLYFRGLGAGLTSTFAVYNADGDGTTGTVVALFDEGVPASANNNNYMQFGISNGGGWLAMKHNGTGTPADLELFADGGGLNQLCLATDGNVAIGGINDPDAQLEIYEAGTQLKLSYDASNYITFAVQSDGDLTLDSNKASYVLDFGDGVLTTTGTLGAGAITGTSFDAGSGTIETTGAITDGTFSVDAGVMTGIASLNGAGTIDLEDNLDGTGFTITAEQLTSTDDLNVADHLYINDASATLDLSTGKIESATGAISFVSADLTTTGTITSHSYDFVPDNTSTITSGSGNSIDITATDVTFSADLTATGDGTFDELTLTNPVGNYKFGGDVDGQSMSFQRQSSGTDAGYAFYNKDGDGTDRVYLYLYRVGTPEDHTGMERTVFAITATNTFFNFASGGVTLISADGFTFSSGDVGIGENLNVTGDGSFDELTLTNPAQDWLFTGTQTTGALGLQSQTSGTQARFQLFTKDGDETDNNFLDIFGQGTPADITPSHKLALGYSQADDDYIIASADKNLRLHSGGGADVQIELNTDGTTDIIGDLTIAGSFFPKQVDDNAMDATNGTEGEIVYNLDDNKFYGCTTTGTPATWAAFH